MRRILRTIIELLGLDDRIFKAGYMHLHFANGILTGLQGDRVVNFPLTREEVKRVQAFEAHEAFHVIQLALRKSDPFQTFNALELRIWRDTNGAKHISLGLQEECGSSYIWLEGQVDLAKFKVWLIRHAAA